MWAKFRVTNTVVAMLGALACVPTVSLAQTGPDTGTAQAAQQQTPRIQVLGVDGALAENIRVHVGTPDISCDASQRRLDRLLPGIRREVLRAAQALGYYQSQRQISFTPATDTEPGCWQLVVNITPGAPVTLAEIDVQITDPQYRDLFSPVLQNLPLRTGDVLNHSAYERLKAMLSGYAVERGFFQARFDTAELQVDVTQNQAFVDIDFNPGARYRFGEIVLNTPDALSQRFVERFLIFEPNSEYSSEVLIQQRQNFNDSQYFSRVSVTPELDNAQNNAVPVRVDLAMRPRKAWSAGAGVNTDTGPRMRFSYEDRYFNRQGHRLTGDLTVSTARQEPSLTYVIPLRDPVNDSLRLSGGFQREETDSYITNTYRAGASYQTLVGNWVQSIFANYEQERSQLTNVLDRSQFNEQTNSLISGISWSRTRSNDPIYPSRGWRLFGQVRGAHEDLISDITFVQLTSSAKFIREIGPGRILLRAEAATTVADELLELPISARFFTGGDTSVRGYEFGELGATNDDGEVVGGKHMLVGSVEYDIPVMGNWYAAAFFDTGNSFSDFDDMQLKESAGLGIRWLSPIGPIRVDVAKGLDRGGSYRLHITMGPDL
ncbi:MAG TPA: hypothetical protein DEG76_14955 [Pseudohongiella sp.]|nr:hypothetical protein [Pseudohongiella sp.]HBX38497.1 hypothetical protein [Pseudohongiella sp.]